MGVEIERKFLVPSYEVLPFASRHELIKQGYINPLKGSVVVYAHHLIFLNDSGKEVFKIDVGNDAQDILKDIKNKDGKLLIDDINIVRIRIKDTQGFITIKGKISINGTPEYEYPISFDIANMLIDSMTDSYLLKLRYTFPHGKHKWEVDHFFSPIQLLLAEVELSSPDEEIEIPDWLRGEYGEVEEVTGDPRYFNSEIIKQR